jgi:hypothetical protein
MFHKQIVDFSISRRVQNKSMLFKLATLKWKSVTVNNKISHFVPLYETAHWHIPKNNFFKVTAARMSSFRSEIHHQESQILQ